jgi:hypothetical protein
MSRYIFRGYNGVCYIPISKHAHTFMFLHLSKVQVKLSLCLIKYHAMKTYGGTHAQLLAFLTSAVDGGD